MVQIIGRSERRVAARKRILPQPLRALDRLAWNYWWSWAADGAAVFRDLDPAAWEECEHNPRRLLAEVSEFRLMQMATDPMYIARVHNLAESFDQYMADTRTWSPRSGGKKITPERPVAYFCAEYGVQNSLPLYSG